ncbi:MAG: hypothetical protein M0031_03015 [Thermaerobacter sp.]|jgi:hypothetical protein|nr:hypothetical protein [Thermaerobacter sp.]
MPRIQTGFRVEDITAKRINLLSVILHKKPSEVVDRAVESFYDVHRSEVERYLLDSGLINLPAGPRAEP